MSINWRFMNKSDLAAICEVASICHPDYPEDEAVLAQKQALAPQSCYILEKDSKPSGYILAHSWKAHNIPPLNQLLDGLPQDADTLYLHDIAILPDARIGGVGSLGLKNLYQQAKALGYSSMSLVAVNNSSPFWLKQGFVTQVVNSTLQQKLLTYSDDAVYMMKTL
ncbi:GNAT family N-acetyltransferase [Bartonella sp. HY761]|uniref:GNAT family N-acetyltransferase n=1 Tax=Bartonella sp. HY761 TaxID=2979330 RepID=UPI0022027C15|nr:GNAT family N-acetyltransferase [Bartonella sp. HY761]UXN06674.1 GNAT family N-acetyltransferase [Bartonella sp. HY761]